MSALLIMAAGPFVSVQDGGRKGAQRYGLPPSGAMDVFALAMANTLAGNAACAPALEIGPFGATIAADLAPLRVALAGALRDLSLTGDANGPLKRPPMSCSFTLEPGQRLAIGPARAGSFSYLAMAGGIDGAPFYGSLSVNVRAGIGSPYPRMLTAGDRLSIKPAAWSEGDVCLPDIPHDSSQPIRIVLGPQDDAFSTDAIDALQSEWTLTPQCDRMGYQLAGPELNHHGGHNIISDGTVNGSIQVPASGAPIVLMPDRGTTGGYPKIATIISADLGRFAQTPPGQRVRFVPVTMGQAQAALRDFHLAIAQLPRNLSRAALTSHDLTQALASANVAGSAVSALDTGTWQHNDSDGGQA